MKVINLENSLKFVTAHQKLLELDTMARSPCQEYTADSLLKHRDDSMVFLWSLKQNPF